MRPAIAAALLLVSATPLAAQEPAPFPSWMAGEWAISAEDGSWTEEFWTHPRGGLMIGASREGKGDALGSWEASRIVRNPDGSLSFIAMPGGRAAFEFPMVKQDDGSIEFANPAHDYPQRIRYWRDGEQLKAEISLVDGSQPVSWSYSRSGR